MLKPELYDALLSASEERDVSISLIVSRACETFLDRLVPIADLERAP